MKIKLFGHKPKWAQWLYDKFGSKLQGWYNWLDDIDLPPNIHAALKKLSSMLPEKILKGLILQIKEYYQGETTEEFIDKVRNLLKIFAHFNF